MIARCRLIRPFTSAPSFVNTWSEILYLPWSSMVLDAVTRPARSPATPLDRSMYPHGVHARTPTTTAPPSRNRTPSSPDSVTPRTTTFRRGTHGSTPSASIVAASMRVSSLSCQRGSLHVPVPSAYRSPTMPTPGAIEDVKVAAGELIEYMTKVIEERQRAPREDLISALVRAEGEEARLSRDELLAFITVLLVAGHETTTHLIGNGMQALLEAPEQLALLRAEPDLVPAAVEEMLRWVTPIKNMCRTVTADTEFFGQQLREGQKCMLLFESANFDETRFAAPERFDSTRSPNEHLAFGFGTHFCLGQALARLELKVMFERLLERLPDLTLAADPADLPRRPANFVSGLESMPVTFTPTGPIGASAS